MDRLRVHSGYTTTSHKNARTPTFRIGVISRINVPLVKHERGEILKNSEVLLLGIHQQWSINMGGLPQAITKGPFQLPVKSMGVFPSTSLDTGLSLRVVSLPWMFFGRTFTESHRFWYSHRCYKNL